MAEVKHLLTTWQKSIGRKLSLIEARSDMSSSLIRIDGYKPGAKCSNRGLVYLYQYQNESEEHWRFREDVREWIIARIPEGIRPERLLYWDSTNNDWYMKPPSEEFALLFKLTWVGI